LLVRRARTIEAKATERAIERLAVTKENVLAELAKLGFANMLDYVQPTAEGDVVVDLSALDRDKAAAVQEVVVDTYQEGRGERLARREARPVQARRQARRSRRPRETPWNVRRGWQGRRYARPVRAWAGSTGYEATRDGVQRLLVGEPKNRALWGTGLIPGDKLYDWSQRQGVPDALDSVIVQHASGSFSTLGFKSYDQGREKWQGETLDFVWFDEEPPMDIYMEGLTRTNAAPGGAGFVYLTMTPLKGMSEVVLRFKDCKGF
jgi:phage terminase large subunit-like protein